MFNKLGRGAGRGGGKRPLAPPQPPANLHRPGGPRLPVGSVPPSSRTRPGAPGGAATAAAAPGKEETFRLAPGELDFAAIIRLTPDLVEEIRRVEAQGGVARIKFDANSKNASNVIDVGGKEFSFDWARDDLCDIYEERRSGEEGDGLLVERGSAWRKLNVHRKFDESAKHVKMRSVEAERMSKSRKSIVLDPTNPSVKNKVNAMAAAAVEGSMRRMNCYNKKDTYSKRRKTEINQGPPKSVFKSGSSIITTKAVLPVSPMPSPPEKPGPAISSSPFGTRNSFEESVPLNINKREIENVEKEMPSRVVHGAIHEVIRKKGRIGDQPMDLRNVLVSLLSENPKGMSYKALEKAVGEKIPNSVQKIENVIKNIAMFQSPGRYFLKPGVEVEGSTRRTSESGSSPESTHDQSSAADLMYAKKAVNEDFEQQAQLSSKVEEECDPSEQIDIMQSNPDDIPDDKRVNDDREGKASSSESGSDSESDSDSSDSESDSGSQSRSRSRSKSKSPVESGSASSSDSESDKSSSSKEGSDVEVDIMTSEDEKEGTEHKTKVAESKLSSSPPWRLSDGEGVQNDIIERDQEAQVASPPLDLNDFVRDDDIAQQPKDFLINGVRTSENPNIGVAKNLEFDPYRENSLPTIDEVPFSLDQQKQSEEQKLSRRKQWLNDTSEAVVRKNVNERPSMLKDRSSHEQQVSTEKNSRTKNKRASGPENFQEKPGNAKKSKAASAVQVKSLRKNKDATISANSHYVSPNKLKQDVYRDHTMQTANNVEWGDSNIDFDSVDYNLPEHRRSIPFGNTPNMQQSPDIRSSEQLGQRRSDVSGRRKNVDKVDKNSEGFHVHPDATPKDKLQKDPRNETSVSERFPTKNGREGDKLLSVLDSYSRKPAENLKDCGQLLYAEKSPRNGKGSLLRRELSDLELGEFREPPVEENGGVKKQFEQKSSFKSVENKVLTIDNSNLDIIKGRSAADALLEIKQQSPLSVKGGVYGNQEGVNRKVLADDHVDSTWPQQRAVPSQHQQSSRGDHDDSDVMFNLDKTTEFAGRIEMKTSQRQVLENAGANKKPPAGMLQQHDIRHGSQKGYKKVKESKSQKSNTRRDFADQNNNSLPLENDINGGRRGSSSDDDNFLCSKYDKDEPELKGPIKDYLQYKEYTQEYREKYDCYCSLNKNLENTRNKFLKVDQELELAKGRDMNESFRLEKQLKEMYQQCGVKHKQMKKVFILLHEELKTLKQRIKDFTSAYNRE